MEYRRSGVVNPTFNGQNQKSQEALKMKKILLLALIIGLSGCAQKKQPIKIGCLFALSGPAGHIGLPSKWVAQMAAERINKEGGINGRPVELIIADTQGKPSQAVVALKRLIEKDKVVAVIGPTRTGTCMASLETIEKAGIPMIACVGGTPPVVPVTRWVFKSPQKTVTAVEKVYEYLQSKGIEKIAIITASDKFGQEGKESLTRLAANYGLTIVAEETFEPADVDMTVQLTKLKGTDAEALICWTIGPAGAIVAKNAKQLKIGIPLIMCHGLADPNFLELAGEAAEGVIMPSTKLMVASQLPDTDPQKKLLLDFINEYENVHKYGKVSTHSGYAWDAIYILTSALRKAGTDPEKLRSAIESTRNYVGISGIYNLSPSDHCGLDASSLVMIKVAGGQWRLIE